MLWGKRDTFAITGTIAVTATSAAVVGTSTLFTTELEEGKTIVIASVKYKILKITDNTHLTLVIPYAGSTASGLTITGTDIPKYIHQQDLQYVYFVDETEANQDENKAKGLNEPGWWFYKTYTDSEGQVRNKAEHLVAIDVLPAVSGDAADDAVVVDGTITITSSGSNRTVTAPAATTFVVTASSDPSATLSYQWQVAVNGSSTYNNVTNTGVYTTATTATLNISNTTGLNGYKYRCVVSATGYTSKTSTYKTLTVN